MKAAFDDLTKATKVLLAQQFHIFMSAVNFTRKTAEGLNKPVVYFGVSLFNNRNVFLSSKLRAGNQTQVHPDYVIRTENAL